jgi:hypothetical protein
MSSLAKLQNKRVEPRIRIRWHAEAYVDRKVYKGFIKEISMTGTGIYLPQSVIFESSFRLRIYMPPFTSTSVPHTMDVTAKVVHSVLYSYESLFRTGVIFTQFFVPTDKKLLQKYIEILPNY